ncbi:MAG: POTRA domain-containing protein, partial [Bacteroidota bacterium]|nr:POTRA domain-containing protein [Bacteroidota bacterium]
MNRLAAPVIALFFLSAGAWTQTHEGDRAQGTPVVTAVAVCGNKTTAREIILRELTIGVGDTVDDAEIMYSQERIYSLGLFNRVRIAYPPVDSTTLIVDVEERWYVYPVPLFGSVERDIRRWYYGIGVKHDNFRGWNEKVFAGFVLGGNPWAGFAYSNPWVFRRGDLSLETSAWYRRIDNKSAIARAGGPNFHETHYTGDLTVGKRFGLFHKLWFGVGFQYVEVSDKRPGRTIAPGGIDRSLWVRAGFQRDTRNLAEYPTSGMYGTVSLARQGVGFGDADMFVAAADLRVYRSVT